MLQSRLIAAVNHLVSNGFYTERGLARLSGISQPQVHNLLKGSRNLTPETADILMEKLNIRLLDLIRHEEIQEYSRLMPQLLANPPVLYPKKPAGTAPIARGNISKAG